MTAVAEPVAIAAGTPITDVAQMTALPVGAVICCQRTGDRYTKVSGHGPGSPGGPADREERWQSPFGQVDVGHFALDGRNVIVSVPADVEPLNEPASCAVGQVIMTVAEMRGLPIGSVLRNPRNSTAYRRIVDGFLRDDGTVIRVERMSRRGLTVESLPDGHGTFVDHLVETLFKVETLAKFKQRFRAACYGHANRAGVGIDPIDQAMERLSVPEAGLHVGAFITASDERSLMRLPDGCILATGDDPSNWQGHSLYGIDRGSLVRLVGGASADHGVPVLVIQSGEGLDEEPDCFTPEEGEDPIEETIAFRKAAWDIGVEAKRDNGWCGDYEQAMASCGIDASIGSTTRADYVTAEECAELPVGTVLRTAFPTVGSATALYRRDDSSGNPAKTVRIGGEAGGSWARLMLVVHRPSEPMRIGITSHLELDTMPEGTVIGCDGDRAEYRKVEGGRWKRDGLHEYAYTSTQMPVGTYRYISIP